MAEAIAQHQNKSSNQVRRIWMVFWILSVITTVEVLLGIFRPTLLTDHRLYSMELLTWIFISLTVVKAYYITWTFMHMEQETASLRRSVVWTAVFYMAYMVFIFLAEGDYLYDAIHNGFLLWDF